MWFFCSVLANLCLALACLSDEKKRIFLFTFFQCVLLSLSSLLSARYGSFFLLLICAVRNVLIATGNMKRGYFFALIIASAAVSLLLDRSWVGCLPLLATVEITVCGYFFSDGMPQTVGLVLNLFLWSLYGLFVSDYPTAIVNGILIFVCFLPKKRYKRK